MLNRTLLVGICLSVSLSMSTALQAGPQATKPLALTAMDYFEIQQLVHRYAFAIDTCPSSETSVVTRLGTVCPARK